MDGQSLIDDGRITTFGRLVEAHALLWHRLDRELQEAMGLSLLWYGVLLHLGRSPGGFRPMGELIGATAFTSGGVTRLVDRMEQSGLVERRPCPGDRRVHYVGLTARGWETLERATQLHLRGIQVHLIDTLSPEDAAQLDAILGRFLATAGAATPSPVE
jgi:DNA-binding MarR family transcriptional regulator